MADFKKRCPRCNGKHFTGRSVRVKNNTGKTVTCHECGLTITNTLPDYVYWRWNRDKEKQAEYMIELVNKAPDRLAFCSKELVEIWGGEANLCKFLSKESGRQVISMPCTYNADGVLFKGV